MNVQRRHRMPFGAEVLAQGVRFRLWAPASKRVDLCLEDRELILPMAPLGDGWFGLVTPEAKPGSPYRYRIDNGLQVPDPASRYNPADVHGPSLVIDPADFEWKDQGWSGRPWSEAVIYELHVGTFTPAGTFAGIKDRLDHLVDLGVTAIELMPVADFPGARNWGYDGALPFAPDSCYGHPEDFKDLVQGAHQKGLMVFLDVVYNHFGPEGNYLHAYAPQFFSERHQTPWGAAINFDGPDSRVVRDFFIHNALYWLEEFHLDGLRLDAVHAIADDSRPDILEELAAAVQAGPGRERHVHLVIENDHNAAHYLKPRGGFEAQWNDDIHHALHVLLTGEHDGYYRDYAEAPLKHLGRCLAEGFAYQGEPSPYRGGRQRGEPSRDLPATRFVSFLQNHDQVGNRALGKRLAEIAPPERLRAAVEILMLSPSLPLLFMGEEWGATQRFPFFCDFQGELRQAVTEGRRQEFARFDRFRGPKAREAIPDACAEATFLSAKLRWEDVEGALNKSALPPLPPGEGGGEGVNSMTYPLTLTLSQRERGLNQSFLKDPGYQEWLSFYRELLRLRREALIPRLANLRPGGATYSLIAPSGLHVRWPLTDGSHYELFANLGDTPIGPIEFPARSPLYASPGLNVANAALPPWTVAWFLGSGVG